MRGTCRAATGAWGRESGAAAKTGTSDGYRDAWFAGYAGNLTGVVWCGRDDNSALPGTGSMIAGPLWTKIMRRASLLMTAEAQQARRSKYTLSKA